mmetsp:Transcript_22709/g.42256  ORF Transcript_22709/g.42256 Transcript_22709/m.42256 type:complete len:214 (-) Transcript_22709:80-721(-)
MLQIHQETYFNFPWVLPPWLLPQLHSPQQPWPRPRHQSQASPLPPCPLHRPSSNPPFRPLLLLFFPRQPSSRQLPFQPPPPQPFPRLPFSLRLPFQLPPPQPSPLLLSSLQHPWPLSAESLLPPPGLPSPQQPSSPHPLSSSSHRTQRCRTTPLPAQIPWEGSCTPCGSPCHRNRTEACWPALSVFRRSHKRPWVQRSGARTCSKRLHPWLCP